MSQENLDLVRRCNDAYNARDIDAYLETIAESVVFCSRFSAMDMKVYEGHEDMRRYFGELDEVWSRYEMKLERLVPEGDRVAGLYHLYAVGRESALQLEERPGVVFTVDGGLIVQIDAYSTQADALAALGAA
jgi:ketosteroid isomerase-like protein